MSPESSAQNDAVSLFLCAELGRAQDLLQDYRPSLDQDLLQRFYKPANTRAGSVGRSQGVSAPKSAPKSRTRLAKTAAHSSVKKPAFRAELPEKTPIRWVTPP